MSSKEEYLEARAILLHQKALGEHEMNATVKTLKRRYPLLDVVVWSPDASPSTVRGMLRAGARDVELSSHPHRLAEAVNEVLDEQKLLPRVQELQESTPSRTDFEGMRSRSHRMWDLFDTATRIAPANSSVLVLGETGTGKELFARAIHARSQRSGAFVAVNCGAIPEHLIDSELFGHVKGAFTGAVSQKKGLFRHADQGTLFLDELGNIPLDVQFRLLRVLQEGLVRPVGGHEELPVDVRVIAATNASLEEMIEEGTFREDLYYRLDVLRIDIPPLRERKEDILFLTSIFVRELVQQYQTPRPELGEEFLDLMLAYDWPGNVRELENVAERLVLLFGGKSVGAEAFHRLIRSDEVISVTDSQTPCQPALGRAVGETAPGNIDAPQARELGVLPEVDVSKTLAEHVDPIVAQIEEQYLRASLAANGGRVGDAAAQAGVNRRTLLRKLKTYGIDKKEYKRQK
jgi:DNA-binding NtrC family response regulator